MRIERLDGIGQSEGASRIARLPDISFHLPQLKQQGYRSIGIDIIIATPGPNGEPYFLIERSKQTKKTFLGQLAHPKETMKRDGNWNIEPLDNAIRRCLIQELGVNLDDVPLRINPNKLGVKTDTHVTKQGETIPYRAIPLVL